MMPDSQSGTVAFRSLAAGTGSAKWRPTISCDESPPYGGAPVTIWKSIAPKA